MDCEPYPYRLRKCHANYQLKFSDNLDYWRKNSYLIPFQNHRAGFILTGNNIRIDGHQEKIYASTWPNINGNGDLWYTDEAGKTREGRPMPFVFWNVTNVRVENFHIKDPQLWAINIMNGTNLTFVNMKSNATATKAPYGENWVQNTDGFDTMDVRNASLKDFWYQGGDDCIAIKPRSHFIRAENITCHGGNGIAIGSLGQYLEDSSVTEVNIVNVHVVRYNEDLHNCAYIKTWIGVPVPQSSYESGGQPRGGGWGNVTGINFVDFVVEGADSPPSITQDNGNNGSFSGTSKMWINDIVFKNFKGWLHKKSTKGSVSCSKEKPCDDIYFTDIHLTNGEDGPENVNGTCRYVAQEGVHGLGC